MAKVTEQGILRVLSDEGKLKNATLAAARALNLLEDGEVHEAHEALKDAFSAYEMNGVA
jgi:hypothetical protein